MSRTVRPSDEFMTELRSLEPAYLESDDPERQSGFSGGRERWIAERSPLIGAIDADGDFLDVGCANGLLVEDVVAWAAERGHAVTPHGIDLGVGLIERARSRLPRWAANFCAADAWSWEPTRRWHFVYTIADLSPRQLWPVFARRLLSWVEPGGRLIVGSYGSRSRGITPIDVTGLLSSLGLVVVGEASAADPPITRFAWVSV